MKYSMNNRLLKCVTHCIMLQERTGVGICIKLLFVLDFVFRRVQRAKWSHPTSTLRTTALFISQELSMEEEHHEFMLKKNLK